MNVLLVTQYFYPENFKSNDLAFELKKRGHEVTVLTGLPNYPEGKLYEGYGVFSNREQNIKGVRVVRSLLVPRGKGSGFRLFINYYSFAFFASLKAKRLARREKFDAVIVHEPSPITQFYPALQVKKIQNTPVYFWVLDLWPESLQFAGGIQNRVILNYYDKLVKRFYSESKKILISSQAFRQSVLEKGDYERKIEYFPNWAEDTIADGATNYPVPQLPEGFKIMFAGNIGEAQDMEAILKAAKKLKKKSEIKFIILGEGRKMPYLKAFVKEENLENTVLILGKYPIEAMSSFFNHADLLLLSLKDDPILNLTVPAKLQAYMAAGKPVVGMLNGEGARTITEADCGFIVPASDACKLAETIEKALYGNPEVLAQKGINGKLYFNDNFTMSSCMDNLERILKE